MSKLFQDSKVIFFDMGNTLIDFHKGNSDIEKDNIGINAVARFLSKKSNKDVTSEFVKREFVDKWFAIMPLRKKLHKEFSIDEFLNPFLYHLGLVFSEKEKINLMILFDSGYQQELVIEKNLQHTLSTLQKKFRIGVISNSPTPPRSKH
jgi:FMN phosphatase YigB (HAD superfamily)